MYHKLDSGWVMRQIVEEPQLKTQTESDAPIIFTLAMTYGEGRQQTGATVTDTKWKYSTTKCGRHEIFEPKGHRD